MLDSSKDFGLLTKIIRLHQVHFFRCSFIYLCMYKQSHEHMQFKMMYSEH